jgi:nucleoside-diphosphate kinase
MVLERSLVLVKPDGVARVLTGKIMQRFEDAGMKIIALKMIKIDKTFAMKHYTEDLAQRRGEKVRNMMIEAITSGPVVAMVIEGVNAIENVRKIVGKTEPREAAPGTIRGDFAHVTFEYANEERGKAVLNVVHASGDKKDADYEVPLWFSDKEMVKYETVYEKYTL